MARGARRKNNKNSDQFALKQSTKDQKSKNEGVHRIKKTRVKVSHFSPQLPAGLTVSVSHWQIISARRLAPPLPPHASAAGILQGRGGRRLCKVSARHRARIH